MKLSGKKKASVKTNFKSIQILSEAVRVCPFVLRLCFTMVCGALWQSVLMVLPPILNPICN